MVFTQNRFFDFQHYWGYTKALLYISPIYVKKWLTLNFGESRPTLYPSNKLDSIQALFSDCHHIIDHIYLGSSYNAADWSYIQSKNIKVIVNVSKEAPCYFDENLEYLHVPIWDDGEDQFTYQDLDKIYQFMVEHKNKGNNILLHCMVGRCRSVVVLIDYLVQMHQMTPRNAIEYIREKRPYANPSICLWNIVYNK